MVQERIDELVDFATTESPRRSATKGWITDFIYLQLGASSEKPETKGEELVNVSVYWNKEIAAVIFGVVFILSTCTFAGVSLFLN